MLDDGVALNLKNLCKFATMNFNYKARVTVNGKTYKAKTTAESPEIAAQKIGVRAATKFPAQNISVGEVEVDAVTTLRNIFKI